MTPAQEVLLRPISAADAPLIRKVYQASPGYFERIAMAVPDLADVEREVEAILSDPNRRAYLIYDGEEPVGYLDYKLHYPQPQDAIVTLILITEDHRNRGYGRRAVADLEAMLHHEVERLFAAVYGDNPAAVAFWESLGYRFLKDGAPSVSWYYKRLKRA